jgi:hypothetical protein
MIVNYNKPPAIKRESARNLFKLSLHALQISRSKLCFARPASETKVFHTRPMESTVMPERPPVLVIDEDVASSEH